tara:strand:- start:1345 stop:1749 length:405 start_codon:yes stop_codon:yes gene_type:complete
MMQYIESEQLYWAITKLTDYLKEPIQVKEHHQGGVLESDIPFMIAKNRPLLRPLGILDWAYYTPKKLAEAVDLGLVEEYYYEMLDDPRSPDNIWKDKEKEKRMKEEYANRYNDDKHLNCQNYPVCDTEGCGGGE